MAQQVATASPSGGASSATSTPEAAAPLTAADLQGRWWNWVASSNPETDPVADSDGRHCASGQSGATWFLADTATPTPVTRECTVPTNAHLAFPIVNHLGTRQACDQFMAAALGTAVLDGTMKEAERLGAVDIKIAGAPGNPVTSETPLSTQACGLWIQLPPLSQGTHTLKIMGRAVAKSVDVTYTLHVQ
ncbi:signal protein [Kitasatospora sp. NPDC051914]|uniref:signal protein n=1 Tax=Kitasatospora sp. NPDC051914 TaxID=3154945 RepID=UPI00341C9843